MKYISTRGQEKELSFEEVLVSGLARDGGLYIPKTWPRISEDDISSLSDLSYQDIALKVMKPYTGDTFSDCEFRSMIKTAYSSFKHNAICPMVKLSKDHFLLELFHGPTLAFKDVAMQIIGQMFDHVLRKQGRRATVVAATSGDTGSAAMEAFKESQLVDLFVLFPKGRVSEVQRRQMTTIGRPNIYAISVDGDFDDCQALVKKMFNDFNFRDSINLTGVNSINWARVMSQIVYYFSAVAALGKPKKGINFTVPTGNFGDIFAGYVAKKMGLPVNKLVIASNKNDILHRTLETGIYFKKGLCRTISPSMDIQVASNFERLLFELYSGKADCVREAMDDLAQDGKFELGKQSLDRFRDDFLSGYASEERTFKTIKKTLSEYNELVCPHTAVGLAVANTLVERSNCVPMVTLATAHPAKFPDAVEECTGIVPKLPAIYQDLFLKDEVSLSTKNNFNHLKKIISERVLG